MIKFTRHGNGLADYISSIDFIDTDQFSKNYFRILDFPTRMFVGKNSFRMSGNRDSLVGGSRIYIDIVDANGNIIYHEVLDVINKDKSRSVVTYVYDDTPTGEATVYVAGRVTRDPITGQDIPYSNSPVDKDYLHTPNIAWTSKLSIVTNKKSDVEVFYTKEPKIVYSEKLAIFREISGSASRLVTVSGSGNDTLATLSRTLPNQYSKTSVFQTSYIDNSKRVRNIPSVGGTRAESKEATQIPEYTDLSVITSEAPLFSDSMKGGTITVTNIQNSLNDATADTTALIQTFGYSASIVRVINDTTVEVDTPYNRVFDYVNIDKEKRRKVFNTFRGEPSFSISYYDDEINLKNSTIASQSYVVMEMHNLEPVAGTLDKIKLSYKSVGSYGDFIDVGEFPLKNQNLLLDTGSQTLSLNDGVVDKQIGYPKSQGDVNTYWTSSHGQPSTLQYKTNSIGNGISIGHPLFTDKSQYATLNLKRDLLLASANTEYTLKFNSFYTTSGSGVEWYTPFIDVYISGSSIVTGHMNRGNLPTPIATNKLGTFIGSVSSKMGKTIENEMSFIASDNKKITPIFVIRAGFWDIGQVELSPRNDLGYSPNFARFNIPLNQLQPTSELIMDIKYLNAVGVAANLDTRLYGVYFNGNRFVNSDGLLSGSSQIAEDISGSINEFSESIVNTINNIVESPWTSSGQDIYYDKGNVSVGTTVTDANAMLYVSGGLYSNDDLTLTQSTSSMYVKYTDNNFGVGSSETRGIFFKHIDGITGIPPARGSFNLRGTSIWSEYDASNRFSMGWGDGEYFVMSAANRFYLEAGRFRIDATDRIVITNTNNADIQVTANGVLYLTGGGGVITQSPTSFISTVEIAGDITGSSNMALTGNMLAQSLTGSIDWSNLDNVPDLVSGSRVESQWTSSGVDIFYDKGSVSIGSSTYDNNYALNVSGGIKISDEIEFISGSGTIGMTEFDRTTDIRFDPAGTRDVQISTRSETATGSISVVAGGVTVSAQSDYSTTASIELSDTTLTIDSGLVLYRIDAYTTTEPIINNLSIGASKVIIEFDANNASGVSLTGVGGGTAGRILIVVNTSATYPLTIPHNDGDSDTASRFLLPSGSDVILPSYGSLMAYHSPNLDKWVKI